MFIYDFIDYRELFEACKSGDIHRVRSMVDASNVNARDTAGRRSSPLHFAAGYGRREAVEHLLMMGGNVHSRDDGGLIPLHNACSFGHAEVVSLLLSAGADPNARDSWSYTPLHEAAVKGKVDVCIMLLQHGADPNLRNSEGKSALDVASEGGAQRGGDSSFSAATAGQCTTRWCATVRATARTAATSWTAASRSCRPCATRPLSAGAIRP